MSTKSMFDRSCTASVEEIMIPANKAKCWCGYEWISTSEREKLTCPKCQTSIKLNCTRKLRKPRLLLTTITTPEVKDVVGLLKGLDMYLSLR